MKSLLRLPEDEIHLWFAFPGDFADAGVSARRILSPGEIARMERLRSAEGRRLFMASHLLARTTLSLYWPCAPEEWRFVANPYGKPLLDPQMGPVPLQFSLSHTAGLAVFALTQGAAIGVDAETVRRSVKALKLSRRFFSPEETEQLRKLPLKRTSYFFYYWTLKESCLKALGRGLSLSLETAAFRLSEDAPCRIEFSGNDLQDPEAWRFALLEPAEGYIAAVSFELGLPEPVKVSCRRALPSGEAADLEWRPVGRSEGVEFLL